MKKNTIQKTAGILILGVLFISGIAAASGEIEAYFGETIPLQGYCFGSQTAYLYLTGPNLPANGVMLNNINMRADEGHFTEVSVDSNDHWEYKWATNSIGGRLDAGTYTIWVVNGPNDRSHLSEADYSTIGVRFGKPTISVNAPSVIPGTMVLYSVPNETSVTVDSAYKGKTPLTLEGLAPGTYTVSFSMYGYDKFTTPVKVASGAISEVTATLQAQTGSLAINTTPAGARIMLDGADAGISPLTVPVLAAGNHTINVTLEGYMPVEQTITILPARTVPVEIELVKPAPSSGIPSSGLLPATVLMGITVIALFAYLSRKRG